jgi:hypothetical protein
MKKILITVFLNAVLFMAMVYPAQNETFLKVPVRVLSRHKAVGNLTKDDFNLRINGKQKEIVEFFKNNRSLSNVNSPRIIVLAFNTTEYGKQIVDGISYFVRDILKEGDSLLVWSPVGMHQILTDRDKKDIIDTIKTIVKNDTFRYKKDIAHPTATLIQIIKKYHADINLGVESQRTIAQFFLSNYSRELKDFMKRFIFPNLMDTRKVAELLAEKTGEKWIINFQDREIIPHYTSYQETAAQIRETAAALTGKDMANATRMYTVLNIIEKTMLLSENLPINSIADALLGADINYNVILFKEAKKSIKMADAVLPDVDGTFKHISSLSGGVAVVNSNLSEGLDIIRKHSDIYYNLVFKINDKWEEKTVSVNISIPNANAYYKQLFIKKEVEAIFEKRNAPGIKITGFYLQGEILKFSISDYEQDGPENKKQGLIRVLIELIDENNTAVYKTRKNLESQNNSIDISLKLPAKYKGNFKISINAFDLVAKKSTQLNKYEKL